MPCFTTESVCLLTNAEEGATQRLAAAQERATVSKERREVAKERRVGRAYSGAFARTLVAFTRRIDKAEAAQEAAEVSRHGVARTATACARKHGFFKRACVSPARGRSSWFASLDAQARAAVAARTASERAATAQSLAKVRSFLGATAAVRGAAARGAASERQRLVAAVREEMRAEVGRRVSGIRGWQDDVRGQVGPGGTKNISKYRGRRDPLPMTAVVSLEEAREVRDVESGRAEAACMHWLIGSVCFGMNRTRALQIRQSAPLPLEWLSSFATPRTPQRGALAGTEGRPASAAAELNPAAGAASALSVVRVGSPTREPDDGAFPERPLPVAVRKAMRDRVRPLPGAEPSDFGDTGLGHSEWTRMQANGLGWALGVGHGAADGSLTPAIAPLGCFPASPAHTYLPFSPVHRTSSPVLPTCTSPSPLLPHPNPIRRTTLRPSPGAPPSVAAWSAPTWSQGRRTSRTQSPASPSRARRSRGARTGPREAGAVSVVACAGGKAHGGVAEHFTLVPTPDACRCACRSQPHGSRDVGVWPGGPSWRGRGGRVQLCARGRVCRDGPRPALCVRHRGGGCGAPR